MSAARIVAACLALLSSSCGPGQSSLFVLLRTDFAPGVEFASVEVLIDERTLERQDARPEADYVGGVSVAETTLPPGEVVVSVRLFDLGGSLVGERASQVSISAQPRQLAIDVHRACRQVRCLDGQVCVQGDCVDASCATGEEPSCPPRCANDTECPTGASCSAARCEGGACFLVGDADACGADEFCDPDVGCVPIPTPAPATCDPGGECAPWSDDCGEQRCVLIAGGEAVCRAAGESRPEGSPCAAATECADGLICVGSCVRACPRNATGVCPGSEVCSGLVDMQDCVGFCQAGPTVCDIYAQDCGGTDSCLLMTRPDSKERFTGCGAAGDVPLDGDCEAVEDRCVEGTLCVVSAGLYRCRRVCQPDGEPACPDGAECTGLSLAWQVTFCRDAD